MLKPFIFLLLIISVIETGAQKRNAANSIATASLASASGNRTNADDGGGTKISSTRKVMEIKIPEGGANGGAVVYHPKEKLYYAAQTGNKEFPLVIFQEGGTIVSPAESTTRMDIRGLWYNPKTKNISGNGYKDFGWFNYEMGKDGIPYGIDVFRPGKNQPDDHSPGVLNTEENEVLFLIGTSIECYSTAGAPLNKTIRIYPGQKSADDGSKIALTDFEAIYNFRSIIYTGYKAAEIGLLNVSRKQVELYNIKTGYMTRIVKLPLSFTPETFFNFSFSNDTYWVFNKATRYWNGFREE